MSDHHFSGHADGAGELVVVTGMTGAGRSTAAKELEDLGFYVVDNLPPGLLRQVVSLVDESSGPEQQIGVVVDVRSGSFFQSLHANLAQGATGRHTTLLFLDASDDVLVRRQEAARRPHPLQGTGRLLDGLQREREVLADLRSDADLVIDTSNLNVHQLTVPDPRVVRRPRRDPAADQRDQLRLQVRHPHRRRLRRRHALPAQPLLAAQAAAEERARPRRRRLREGPARRGAVPGGATCPCSRAWPWATSPRASGS